MTDAVTDDSIRTRLVHFAIGFVVGSLYRIARLMRRIRRKKVFDPEAGAEVLLTGTFNSTAWIMAFIAPITKATACKHVALVTTHPMSDTDGLTVITPPSLLCRLIGDVPARLLVFVWQAIRRGPLLVGGFHVSINALVAEFAASLSGSRSLYVCVGGPIEVQDGGLWGESRFFSHLRHADATIESKLLRSIREFDVVAPMGRSGADYFRDHGISEDRIKPLTGGVDAERFDRPPADRTTDVIFLGRLVPIKTLELLLQTIRVMTEDGGQLRARIVGRGPKEQELRRVADELAIRDHVEFAGFVPDVVDELMASKCFVLTSRSEGLSLAMIEAMLAGAVPVVADVGDLGDLVEHGVNGYLVDSRDPAAFAGYIRSLIDDPETLSAFSDAAYTKALRCDVKRVAQDWDALLRALR